MQEIDIKFLKTGAKLGKSVYHTSGELMHKPDEALTLENLALMEQCGINRVVVLEAGEDDKALKLKIQKKTVGLDQLREGEALPVTLYDAHHSLVAEEGSVVREDLLNRLRAESINELYYMRDAQELDLFQYNRYLSLLESDMFESLGSIVVLEHPLERERKDSERIKRLAEEKHEREAYDFSRIIINPERMILNPAMELSTARLKTAMKTNGELRVAPAGPALATVARRIVDERNEAAKQAYQSSYDKWIKALAGLFTRLKANQQVPFQEIDSLAKEIITSYAKDSFYLLNLANNRNGRDAGEYLASHCLNVACIAAGMGAILGFNATQAVEIIIGALFHDVGHMLTYQPLLLKESLDSTEQQKYDEHAQLGVAMLKNVSTLPKSTPFIVYQHHERLDGSGRLLHCFDAAIHDFAKLIAVADEYEILSRKQSPPAAISKTLSGAKDKSLDVMAVRALLLSYSLYPIGSMVLITGNRVCKVVATHPTQFKTPIVRTILSIKDNKYEAVTKRELIDLSTVKGVAVERCISHPVLNRKIGIGF